MKILLPETVADACAMLAAEPEAVPMAGGTDLLVHWPERLDEHDKTYLDLSKLDELKPILWKEDELVLGGLTTYWDVILDQRATAEFPLLSVAARQVGAIQIQSRGTWAGNIVNASPAADGVPVLMAYDATVVLQGKDGREEVPLSKFYTGYKEMRRRPDQLVRAIRIPRRHYSFQIFEKVGPRAAQAITKVGTPIARKLVSIPLPGSEVFRDAEALIYDRLAVTVTGETLTDVYLQQRRALEAEERGGAQARVEAVEVLEARDISSLDSGFLVRATWTVGGMVTHFGHRHFRQNRYDANIQIVPVEGSWKLQSIEVLEQERVQ